MTPEKRRRPLTRASKSPATPKGHLRPIAVISSPENSSGELVIDVETDENMPNHSTPGKGDGETKRIFRRKRRKICLPRDDDELLFDAKFEETIRKSAAKNSLTPMCVKRLLKKLVVNDHVFAIVRLKEEEEQRENSDTSDRSWDADDGDDEDDEESARTLPKLTRLKAKQLNQTLFPLVPLNAPATDKAVAALIREDLNSDDDDEEYKPGEDDVPSDDDPNTTISDIDSQPRTPATTLVVAGADLEPELQYTKDGLFKIPKPRNDSCCSQSEQEQENIALRTRSKLCLTTTDIETLESTFVPPDITTDMYEHDGDMDQAWKDFLEEFTKPLPQDLEDDDDNDPEYVAADKVPLDAEEMRVVKVSKKELNELISELMEMSNIDEPYLEQALNETINESLSCTQIDSRSDMLRTPLPPEPSDVRSGAAALESTYPTMTEKLPVTMVAVAGGNQNDTVESHGGGNFNDSFRDQSRIVLAPTFTSTPNMPLYRNLVIRESALGGVVQQYETAPENAPETANISDVQSSSVVSSCSVLGNERFFIKYSVPDETTPPQYDSSIIAKPAFVKGKRNSFRSTEVPVNVVLSDEPVGFVDFQLHLLQQQLRMHVQLTAQHFLQTYAHPLFWEQAANCKGMLEEVEVIGKSNPTIMPWNLPLALECCRSWEHELSVVNESNKQYMQFLDEEISRAETIYLKSSKHPQSEFHWRIREKIINCRAFMYPSLVPGRTFRLAPKECRQPRFTAGELHLIAFWLERSCEQMKEEHHARYANKLQKKPTMRDVCNYAIKHFWPNYTLRQLDSLLHNKNNNIYSNPIYFFVKNGYAPPFKHVLEYIDFNKVVPLASYQRGILPPSWDRYISTRKTTPVGERKDGLSAKEEKGKCHQASPAAASSPVPETSDARIWSCKIQVLLPAETDSASSQVYNSTSISVPSGTKCESVNGGAVDPSLADVAANSSEISFSVVLADEPNSTKDMPNDGPYRKTSRSMGDSVSNECSCNCHSSIGSVQDVPVASALPEGVVPYADGLTDSSDKASNDAKQLLLGLPNSPCRVPPAPHNKNVVKHSVNRLAASATLYTTLKRYLQQLREECNQNSAGLLSTLKPSHPVGKVYIHLLQLYAYSRFLGGLRKMCENLASYCHRYRTLQQYNPQRLSGFLQLSHFQQVDGSLVVSARYISHRFDDYCSMEDKDAVFAFNYYEKVEETLVAAGRSDLLERFEEVLKKFNELEDSAPQLYYQVEELLGERFPELVDIFLTFLLPGQAAEVGRFFEHFILTNMSDFLEKLNIFFAKQPSQIKKVHACLNELSNEPNVTMDQLKLKVLPLLKGSTLLSEWFLQLFPTERPPESPLCDYENVTLKKPPLVETCDSGLVYEQVPYVETAPESTENAAPPNAIRYIQGRIYQGALPARLTFLANNCLTKVNTANGASSSNLEQHLCDEATLKAHAIRLNPLVHGPKGVTYADVAHLLTADGNAVAGLGPSHDGAHNGVNTEDETKDASWPKKVPPKLPIKKRFNSPTSRKLAFSPNEDSSTASSSPSKESVVSARKAPATVSPDSKALSTSKKLKSIIEAAPASSNQEEGQHEPPPLTSPPLLPSASTYDCPPSTSTNGPTVPDEHREAQESAQPPNINTPASAPEAPSWTREEDEIILLKLIKGYTSVDAFVQLIEQQLPERTNEQIRSRVEFLNEMLQRVNKK